MDPPFAVRIVTADFYMAKPVSGFDVGYSDFRCSPVRHVPVIRIYGATPAGQRTCLHIHGVFPYVYVSCEDVWQTSSEFMHHLSSSVDRALHLCLDRGTRTPEHAVYKIVPVSGIPFYGYHEEEKLFLKIYLYNPFMTTRVVKLLQSGAVMNRPFQPHEAHIPYLLQFFIDYNLYGMSFIELAIVKFRLPLTPGSDQFCSASLFSSDDKSSELDSQRRQVWREANVSKEIILPANVSRQSVCELEVDAVAADILNRRKIGRGTLANPGLAAVWEDERQRRKQKGESSQISHPLSLERKLIEDFEIESNWKKKLHQIIERHMEQIVNDPCRKTETADAVRNEDSFSLSCASQVENHLSQINQELMGSDSVMYEEEGIVDEEVIQQVLEISQSQPAYSQRVDSETVRLLANLDQLQQVSQSGSQSPANESDIIDGSFPIDQSWESSLNFSQMQHNLSQMVKNSARVLSQTTSESGLASVNRTIESHCIEELLGCGAHIDDEQELSDLVNAVVEEEAESLAMSQCGTWIDKIEENKTCPSSFDDAAAAMMDEYEKPTVGIPQLDGSKDIPGKIQQRSALNRYKQKKKASVATVIGSSPDSEKDFKVSKGHYKQAQGDRIQTRLSSKRNAAVECSTCVVSSQQKCSSRFLTPLVKKLSRSDIEDLLESISHTGSSGSVFQEQSIIGDTESECFENASMGLMGAFDSQEDESTLSSTLLINRVQAQKPPHLKFSGKEKCSFYRNSLFQYSCHNEPYCRAGDETMLERFCGYGCSDNIDSLSCLAFTSPSASPLPLDGNFLVKASDLFDDFDLNLVKESENVARQDSLEPSAKKVRFSIKESNERVASCDTDVANCQPEKSSYKMGAVSMRTNDNLNCTVWTPARSPPTSSQLLDSAVHYGIRVVKHQAAFYSRVEDVAPAREVGGLRLCVPSNKLFDLDFFNTKKYLPIDKQHASSCGALSQWRTLRITNAEGFSQDIWMALVSSQIRSRYSGFDAEMKQKGMNIRCSLIGDRRCIITPAKRAIHPSKTTNWLKKRRLMLETKTKDAGSDLKNSLKSVRNKPASSSTATVTVQTDSQAETSIECFSLQTSSQVATLHLTEHSTPKSQRSRKSLFGLSNCTPIAKQGVALFEEATAARVLSSVIDSEQRHLSERTPLMERDSKFSGSTGLSDGSFLDGPTQNDSYGFKISQHNMQNARALHECQHLTQLSMEVHVKTRRDMKPDPAVDPICAIFYCIWRDLEPDSSVNREVSGLLVVDQDNTDIKYLDYCGLSGLSIQYNIDEKELLNSLVQLTRRHDPDILVGYEVQMLSWGYVLQRAGVLNIDLEMQLSRVPDKTVGSRKCAEDEYSSRKTSEVSIGGRIMLNVWRLMRHEVTLNVYSLENVVYHVLHKRIPLFTFRKLSEWFDDKTRLCRWRTVEHYMRRCRVTLELLEQLDLICQTSELARLFGILFYSVLSRGSQYRVESMMLRIAKPMNYIAVTPSPQQRAKMNAPECLQLILEPESRFYVDPVLVLDFQSLYPSIIIAYNYCFCTCLGRVTSLAESGDFKFGVTSLNVEPTVLKKLESNLNISPNGVAFVNSSVRRGVLPRMLEEILQARIMVKQSIKECKDDKTLCRMLNLRQLGLKLIANVTYGYTSANFSGRMPCIEVADSIVRKARETLERAIQMVNSNTEWNARVVYGDTDSMFVLLKGRSKEDAFRIGQEIVTKVTAANPKPVKLKFEKVYLPCILETKKRYVGFMYETINQVEPEYDAKGIETVRRDGCPAVVKILEKSLKLLFTTRDVSRVKRYVQKQFMKMGEERISLQEFIFAKEYRGISTYKPGACVPALEITKQLVASDPRAEPRLGERVPYVVVYGSPGLPLIQLVRRPEEILRDPSLRINYVYYATKQIIPPLNRVFSLMGVDVRSWYTELPKFQRAGISFYTQSEDAKKGTISQYFGTTECPVCDEMTRDDVCQRCRRYPQSSLTVLGSRIRTLERNYKELRELCFHCVGRRDPDLACVSLDCPNLYRMRRATNRLQMVSRLQEVQSTLDSTS